MGTHVYTRSCHCAENYGDSLVQNGRIAVAVWSTPAKVPLLDLAFGTVMKEMGVPPPPTGTPGPFSLADADLLSKKFEQAGFKEIKTESHNMNARIPSPEEFTAFQRDIAAPLKMMMAGLPAARREEIWNTVTEAARKHTTSGTEAISLENEVIYLSATK